MSYNSFAGVLGGHHNYLVHMCFKNFCDYEDLVEKEGQEEKPKSSSEKYKELRYFLNTIESFNNVLDYVYWEYEDEISFKSDNKFRERVHLEYPALGKLADLANAYKHCVRKGENKEKIRASELQEPKLDIILTLKEGLLSTEIEYSFSGVIPEHREILLEVWKYWIEYHNKPDYKRFTELV